MCAVIVLSFESSLCISHCKFYVCLERRRTSRGGQGGFCLYLPARCTGELHCLFQICLKFLLTDRKKKVVDGTDCSEIIAISGT